jgi:aryl-alcohol dehydrogenase-like predicted oxidoreductase
MTARLGLGSAQFGSAYGVSNRVGCPDGREIREILDLAQNADMGVLDTAPAYGDAEQRIGRCLDAAATLPVVTKTLPIAEAEITPHHAAQLIETFKRSLDHLKRDHLHGLLIHHPEELFRQGGDYLADALFELKQLGLVRRVGVSVYTAADINAVWRFFPFDLIQLPLNVADQRLLQSGHIGYLKRHGVEVHARSIFLQGALLMSPDELPAPLAGLAPYLARFTRACRAAELSPLEACLAFVLRLADLDFALVGVNSAVELSAIVTAAQRGAPANFDFPRLALRNPFFLNPANWPKSPFNGGSHAPVHRDHMLSALHLDGPA